MIDKVKRVAHYTISKTCEVMDSQRVRFQVRDIQKQKDQVYISIGKYVETQSVSFEEHEYLYKQFVLLKQLNKELEMIQDTPQDFDDLGTCPTCGTFIMGNMNFCPNCGGRIS